MFSGSSGIKTYIAWYPEGTRAFLPGCDLPQNCNPGETRAFLPGCDCPAPPGTERDRTRSAIPLALMMKDFEIIQGNICSLVFDPVFGLNIAGDII